MTETPTTDTPDEIEHLLEVAEWAIKATTPDERVATQPRDDNLDLALAAAARCRRLLMGLVTIVRADLYDVAGLLVRSIYEHWLVGAYTLLGGADARQRLVDQQDRQQRKMAKEFGVPDADSLPKGKSLTIYEMAAQVTKLLHAEGSPTADFAEFFYRNVYAAESAVSTHGGLASVRPYIADSENGTILSAPPEKPILGQRLLVAIQLVVSAAQMPAVRCGLPHEELDRLAFAVSERSAT